MAEKRYEDLYASVCVVETEKPLVGRLDSAVAGVTSTADEHKRATGINGICANTGYLVGRLGSVTKFVIGIATLNGLAQFAPLDIEVPIGQTLSVHEMTSVGTAACEVTLQYELVG